MAQPSPPMQPDLSKISHPASLISGPAQIKNIIFDFGGVICNLDIKRTEKQFLALGLQAFTPEYAASGARLFQDIETGVVTSRVFRDTLRQFFPNPVSDAQIDDAWNALLLEIPEPRIRVLEKLRKHYRIFLLSNSNEIHYLKYVEDFRRYGYHDFDDLFEKAYFSFQLGCKKPSPEIFTYVLNDAGLNPSETLFIDDTLVHVKGAQCLGIQAHHLKIDQGEQFIDLFKQG